MASLCVSPRRPISRPRCRRRRHPRAEVPHNRLDDRLGRPPAPNDGSGSLVLAKPRRNKLPPSLGQRLHDSSRCAREATHRSGRRFSRLDLLSLENRFQRRRRPRRLDVRQVEDSGTARLFHRWRTCVSNNQPDERPRCRFDARAFVRAQRPAARRLLARARSRQMGMCLTWDEESGRPRSPRRRPLHDARKRTFTE